MKRTLLVLMMLLAVAACSKQERFSGMASETAQSAPAAPSAKTGARYMAYQHSIHIDTEENKVSAIFAAAQKACQDAAADLCEVLDSNLNTGRNGSASLKFRAKASGIRKIIAALSKQADVTQQATSAEDLSGPIADTAKQLEMLQDYRSKLEALRERAKNDVDALIKVNKELAQVQSELEAMTGKRAHLMKRVDTEILSIFIVSRQNKSFWRPISDSLSDFGGNLSQGISVAITGIAYLLPWGVFFLFAGWGIRKLWRRKKKAGAA